MSPPPKVVEPYSIERPNTASPTPARRTPYLPQSGGGALGERRGHARRKTGISCSRPLRFAPALPAALPSYCSEDARWARQAVQLPKLGISFDGGRSGRRHFVADTA